MRNSRLTVCFIAIWFTCGCAAIHSQTTAPAKPAEGGSPVTFMAGGAYADITPEHAMPNYNGVHLELDKNATPLRVQAIVLGDGTARATIISVDCTFLGRTEVGRIRDALHQRVGLKPENICIAATHSHASPATTASFLTGELPDPKYIDLLVGQTSRAVEQAISRMKPARVVAASIDAPPKRKTTF